MSSSDSSSLRIPCLKRVWSSARRTRIFVVISSLPFRISRSRPLRRRFSFPPAREPDDPLFCFLRRGLFPHHPGLHHDPPLIRLAHLHHQRDLDVNFGPASLAGDDLITPLHQINPLLNSGQPDAAGPPL